MGDNICRKVEHTLEVAAEEFDKQQTLREQVRSALTYPIIVVCAAVIVVIFMLGLFWKRASEAGALTAAIGSVVLSAVFWWLQETGQFIFPFMNRVGVVFIVSLIAAVVVSLLAPAKPDAMKIKLDKISYKTSLGFNLAGLGVIAFLILVYSIWW